MYNKNLTHTTSTAFVSTNSISQGEQVGILWNELFNNYKLKFILLIELLNGVMKQKVMQQFMLLLLALQTLIHSDKVFI